MDKARRERSANFSLHERDILVSLVQKYQHVLENKQSDASTWKKKEAAWELIQNEFNAQSGGIFRSIKTLKVKYESLKRSVRKKSAAIRTELYRTGGGKNTAPPLDKVEEQIKAMITLSTDGLESQYDSDILPQNQEKTIDVETMEDFTIEIPCLSVNTEDDAVLVENEATKNQILQIVLDECPITTEKLEEEKIKQAENLNTPDLYEIPKKTCTPTSSSKKWDVTSWRNLRSKKHLALTANIPKKNCIDELTEAKMELIKLQKGLLEAEIIEKKNVWEFEENERKKEAKRREEEHKWKEEEHKWKKEEHKLKMEKIKKELF